MFLRLVADSFGRRPRRKLLTGAALALGMAVVTAAFSVSLDVGDRLSHEFRALGANLLITPQADSLPLEIGGVDYRPVNSGSYLPQQDLGKIKTIFWRNNIVGFAPVMEVPAEVSIASQASSVKTTLVGTWAHHSVALPDERTYATGMEQTNSWWHVDGRWFRDDAAECIVGKSFAARTGIKPGDTLHINSADRSIALTVTGILSAGGPEDDAIVAPLQIAQQLANKPGQYRRLYVSALTKPEDDFARRNPSTMNAADLERWSCSPYASSIAYQVKQVLPGVDAHVIRRVAEGEGSILTRVRTLLWLASFAALLAAALAVGASSAASVIERRSEIGLMKAIGAGSGTIGFLLAAEQLLLAFVGGGVGYALGIILARILGEKIFGVAPQPSILVFVVILALAACVTLLGSAIPLHRASRYEPAPILRGE
ncbi:MAG TPA: ABC transporter permease [Candidatus Dormibacteraeota bacterium]|nr:ABC transporter permease [Candidatus Dormibacteraeota bacterium]